MGDQVRYARSLAGKRGNETSEFLRGGHAFQAFPSFPVEELVPCVGALPGMQPQDLRDMFALGLFPPLRLGPVRQFVRAETGKQANAPEANQHTQVPQHPACSKAASTPPRVPHIATPPHPRPASIIEDDVSDDDFAETPPDASSRPSRKRPGEQLSGHRELKSPWSAPLPSAPHGARAPGAAGTQQRMLTALSTVDRQQVRDVAGGRGPRPLQGAGVPRSQECASR
ncbi:hypothetical protein T484DRAFT_1928346 [Baffinella frigidus]|nr:hypothetical protein T484DRAFT_1928346 [Cryptophyta sp. CCMP2293]